MRDHRGVALLELLLKWYINCLVRLLERLPPPPQAQGSTAFGFTPHRSCGQINACLRNLLSKGWEWQDVALLFCFFGDVLAVFDFLTASEVSAAFIKRQVLGQLAAALLREGQDMFMEPRFAHVLELPTIPFHAVRADRQYGRGDELE